MDTTTVAPRLAPAAPSVAVPLGRLLFRFRGWMFVPLAVFSLLCVYREWEADAVLWPLGISLMAAGAALRFRCIRFMGGAARTHKDSAKRLVRSGPYAWVRNPLYLANVTAFLGFVVLCELAWFVPVAGLLLMAAYHAVARYEETVLAAAFPREFPAYRSAVPMWIPRPPREDGEEAPLDLYPVAKVLRRERGAVLNLGAMILLAAAKEWLAH